MTPLQLKCSPSLSAASSLPILQDSQPLRTTALLPLPLLPLSLFAWVRRFLYLLLSLINCTVRHVFLGSSGFLWCSRIWVTHVQFLPFRCVSLPFEALPLHSNPPLLWLRHARHLPALNPSSRGCWAALSNPLTPQPWLWIQTHSWHSPRSSRTSTLQSSASKPKPTMPSKSPSPFSTWHLRPLGRMPKQLPHLLQKHTRTKTAPLPNLPLHKIPNPPGPKPPPLLPPPMPEARNLLPVLRAPLPKALHQPIHPPSAGSSLP